MLNPDFNLKRKRDLSPTIEHLHPVRDGGLYLLSNIVCCCEKCNVGRRGFCHYFHKKMGGGTRSFMKNQIETKGNHFVSDRSSVERRHEKIIDCRIAFQSLGKDLVEPCSIYEKQ